MTDAPSAASDFAIAAPMPLDAPVTTATFPLSLLISLSLFCVALNFECLRGCRGGLPLIWFWGVDGAGFEKDSLVPDL